VLGIEMPCWDTDPLWTMDDAGIFDAAIKPFEKYGMLKRSDVEEFFTVKLGSVYPVWDVDFEAIEKSHSYLGYYFILGGTVPILEKEPEKKIRAKELLALTKKRATDGLKEIIVATSVNPEGENTSDYVAKLLSPDGIRRPEDYRPISVVEFFDYMKLKTWKPIDHHGRD
jgi:hypothetical protein